MVEVAQPWRPQPNRRYLVAALSLDERGHDARGAVRAGLCRSSMLFLHFVSSVRAASCRQ